LLKAFDSYDGAEGTGTDGAEGTGTDGAEEGTGTE